jgi:hypothetical protein
MVSYASVVESLMNAKDRTYPDIVHISGLFWQCLVQDGVKCISLMLCWKDQVLSKGSECKDRICEMCSKIHNCHSLSHLEFLCGNAPKGKTVIINVIRVENEQFLSRSVPTVFLHYAFVPVFTES